MPEEHTIQIVFGDGDDQRRRIVFEDGDSEMLLVSPIGGDLFRLEESSVLDEGTYHDVIRAVIQDDGSLQFQEIVSLSGFTTQRFLLSKEIIGAVEFHPILDFIMKTDGNWEQMFGGLLYVHVPPHVADKVADQINTFMRNRRS